MADELSPRWDLWSGWHFVRWLVGLPVAADWLVGWSSVKCHLCIDVKDGHPLKIWIRISLAFCPRWLVGWPIAARWLTGPLTKCQRWHLLQDLNLHQFEHFVRWLVGWPIAARWLTGPLTKCQPDPPSGSDFGLGWHFVRWLVGWPIPAGWLAIWQNVTCILM